MPQPLPHVARLLLAAACVWTSLTACTGTEPRSTGSAVEQAVRDVRAIYAPYGAAPGSAPDPARRHIWSGAMLTLIRNAVTPSHPMYGSDWLCDCDRRAEGHFNLTVVEARQNTDRSVTVSIRIDPPSNDRARFIALSMVRERYRWVIDDLFNEDHDLSLRGDIEANRVRQR